MRKLIAVLAITGTMVGQAPAAKPQATATPHKPTAAVKSSVDAVIELVQGGMSEALVIKLLQRDGKAYNLTTIDVLKLQKAGVSENIINVMLDPTAKIVAQADPPSTKNPTPGGASSTPVPPPPAIGANTPATPIATPYPPDLPNVPPTRKRRVIVAVFSNAAIKDEVQSFYQNYYRLLGIPVPTTQNNNDVGRGIRALLMSRLQKSGIVTVLERDRALEDELKEGPGSTRDQGSQPRPRLLGADCVITGDITTFGWETKTKSEGGALGGVVPKFGGLLGGGIKKKEDKAVVNIEFRIADIETSESLLTASARGESTRKGTSLGIEGLGGGSGGVAGGLFQHGMTSSGFERTILGEATIDAVEKIVKQVEEKIPQLPAKPRNIEGRIAAITDGGVYMDLGANDGVLLGDRFEVRKINNEVVNSRTQETLALDAVKIGELVVKEVDNKAVLGDYGGQPLSADYMKGKGYQVRLMSK